MNTCAEFVLSERGEFDRMNDLFGGGNVALEIHGCSNTLLLYLAYRRWNIHPIALTVTIFSVKSHPLS